MTHGMFDINQILRARQTFVMTRAEQIELANTIRNHNHRWEAWGDSFSVGQRETLAAFCQSCAPDFQKYEWLNYIAGRPSAYDPQPSHLELAEIEAATAEAYRANRPMTPIRYNNNCAEPVHNTYTQSALTGPFDLYSGVA